jgi:hypothetical protein
MDWSALSTSVLAQFTLVLTAAAAIVTVVIGAKAGYRLLKNFLA